MPEKVNTNTLAKILTHRTTSTKSSLQQHLTTAISHCSLPAFFTTPVFHVNMCDVHEHDDTVSIHEEKPAKKKPGSIHEEAAQFLTALPIDS
jgi:hypothetical protein